MTEVAVKEGAKKDVKDILNCILEELSLCISALKEEQIRDLESRIKKADQIFVAGAGRSLLMVRGLAMRLMHMGFASYVVGETVTPAIGPGDLLVIASGSGTTGTLKVMAEKCKQTGADLALITTMPDSPIGKLADCIVKVDAATTKSEGNTKKSIQPGANTFEQSVLLLGDALVIHLTMGGSLEKKNQALMEKHANLE